MGSDFPHGFTTIPSVTFQGCRCIFFRLRSKFAIPYSIPGTIMKLLITSMDETGHTFYTPLSNMNVFHEYSLLVSTFAMTAFATFLDD